jgi:hypothetical protein
MGGGLGERRELDLMLSCARREAVDWVTAARVSPVAVMGAAKMLSVAGAFPECAEDASRALLANPSAEAFHQGAILLLQSLWAAQGRESAVIALIDSASAAGWWQVSTVLYPIDALAGLPGFDAKVAEGTAALRNAYGAAYEDSLDGGRLLLLGAWYLHRGRMADGVRLEERLSRRAAGPHDPEARLRSDALKAHLLLARGDSTAALIALERIAPVARRDFLTWGYTESFPFERLVEAELLFSLGRYQDAIHVADGFDHPMPVVYLPFLPASLILRYRAAQALNHPARAAGYRRRLAALDRTGLLRQPIVSPILEDDHEQLQRNTCGNWRARCDGGGGMRSERWGRRVRHEARVRGAPGPVYHNARHHAVAVAGHRQYEQDPRISDNRADDRYHSSTA